MYIAAVVARTTAKAANRRAAIGTRDLERWMPWPLLAARVARDGTFLRHHADPAMAAFRFFSRQRRTRRCDASDLQASQNRGVGPAAFRIAAPPQISHVAFGCAGLPRRRRANSCRRSQHGQREISSPSYVKCSTTPVQPGTRHGEARSTLTRTPPSAGRTDPYRYALRSGARPGAPSRASAGFQLDVGPRSCDRAPQAKPRHHTRAARR